MNFPTGREFEEGDLGSRSGDMVIFPQIANVPDASVLDTLKFLREFSSQVGVDNISILVLDEWKDKGEGKDSFDGLV